MARRPRRRRAPVPHRFDPEGRTRAGRMFLAQLPPPAPPRREVERRPVDELQPDFAERIPDPLYHGETIELGGLEMQRYINPLVEGTPPAFVFNEEMRRLEWNWGFGLQLHISLILSYDEDDAEERNLAVPINTRHQQAAFMRLILGEESQFPDEVMDELLEQFQEAVMTGMNRAERNSYDYVVDHMIEFSYQGIQYRHNVVDEQGNLVVQRATTRHVSPDSPGEETRLQRIAADVPLVLPFRNLIMNEGPDEACVDRFIGMDLSRTPYRRTAAGMRDIAVEHGFGLELFDLIGGYMIRVDSPDRTDPRRGLVYNGHVYPLRSGRRPQLIAGPKYHYTMAADVYDHELTPGNALYAVNGVFYIGNNGVYMPEARAKEDWMSEILELLPNGNGWDPTVMPTIKDSALALHYVDPALEKDGCDESKHVAFDMTKCYWQALLTTIEQRVDVGSPSIYTTWRELDEDEQNWTVPHYYYKVDADIEHLGFRTDIIQGRMVSLLRRYKFDVRLLAVLEFENGVQKMGAKHKEKLVAILKNMSMEGRKKVAIINGIMGRVRFTRALTFLLSDEDEQRYYTTRYNAEVFGERVTVAQPAHDLINRLHWHVHVIHFASYQVLCMALEIHRHTNVWPVRIATDSLTYEIMKLRTPFHPDGVVVAEKYFAQCKTNTWHREAVRYGPPRMPHMFRRVEIVDSADQEPYDNTTYVGPPGVGKTHTAINTHEIDLAICYSNKGARRINGKTIHSAMKIWGKGTQKVEPELEELRGLTVFVDELQAANRLLHAFLMQAYLRVGARFVFAMDPDQIPPVGEAPLACVDSARDHPFFGHVIRLRQDHRNDTALVQAREAVLNGSFDPVVFPWARAEELYCPLRMTAIAYRVRTCSFVNEMARRKLGIEFGHPRGRYITTKSLKSVDVINAEMLRSRGDGVWVRSNGTEFTMPKKRDPRSFITWAFCITTHKMIGETVDTNDERKLAIFDWGSHGFSLPLKYTALTRARRMQDVLLFGAPRRDDLPRLLDGLEPAARAALNEKSRRL